MAFPSVVATSVSAQDVHANPVDISLPAGIQAGDMIVVAIRTHVGPLTASDQIISGYTHLVSRNWGGYTGVFSKIATGSEGATVPLNLGVNAKSAHAVYVIRDHGGNIEAVMNPGNVNDPPSIITSWGDDDNLFLAVLANRPSDSTVTAAPTGYTGLLTSANASSTALDSSRVSMAYRTSTVATEDADAFTVTGIQEPHSVSVAIQGGEASGPVAPVASFSASTTTGYAPLGVSFTDSSTGQPETWFWDFGDDTTSTDQNPTHTYAQPGTYTVSLIVTNSVDESIETKIDYITVSPAPENTFSDPSFEQGAAGWNVYGASIDREAGYAHTGSYSLRLAPWEVWGGAYYVLPNISSATPQTFSAWVRGEGGNVGKTVNVLLKNEDTGQIIKSPNLVLTDSWQQATVTHTPSASAQLSLQIQGVDLDTSSYVYIDDVFHLGEYDQTVAPEVFSWKGYDWQRRSLLNFGHGQPMYNGQWSRDNVLAPTEDGLTLRLTNDSGNSPVGAEVRTVSRNFGYGTYISVVNTRLDTMHPSIVFGGMFTFDEDAPPAYDEIDVHESSAWGNSRPTDFSGVQLMHNMWRPLPDNSDRWVEDTWMNMPSEPLQTHRLIWEPGKMTVDSFLGEGTDSAPIMHHEFTDVPVPKKTRIHYNLWVVGSPPANPATATPIDVTIKHFSYTPASGGTIKVRHNGEWVSKPIKVYTSGGYVTKPLKRYNGSEWVIT